MGVCRADGYRTPKIGRQQGRLAYLPDVTLLDGVVLVKGGVTTHSAPSDGVQSTDGGYDWSMSGTGVSTGRQARGQKFRM